jgi:hypothetical protein
MAEFLERDKSVLESLALLVHFTGGMPARAAELFTALFENQDHERNLFVRDGHVYLSFSIHRKNTHSSCSRSIERFFPPPVAQILVQYLTIIVPFKRFLLLKAGVPSKVAGTPLIWYKLMCPLASAFKGCHTKEWDSRKLSCIMQQHTEDDLRVSFGVQIWRHLATAITKKFLIKVSNIHVHLERHF